MIWKYLGPTIKKVFGVPRNIKKGYFSIGKASTKETDESMTEILFHVAPTRTYDSRDLIRNALKQMRKFTIPCSKACWEEDLIINCLNIEDYKDMNLKWRELMRVEEEMRREYLFFKGFQHEERYSNRYNKYINNFYNIYSKVPPKIRDKAMPQSLEHADIIDIDIEDDYLESSSWAHGGRKKLRLIEFKKRNCKSYQEE